MNDLNLIIFVVVAVGLTFSLLRPEKKKGGKKKNEKYGGDSRNITTKTYEDVTKKVGMSRIRNRK